MERDLERINSIEDLSTGYEPGSGSNPRIDNVKVKIAEGIKSAASVLKQQGAQNGSISGYLNQASGWLDNTADYVEDLNVSKVKNDIQSQMRANPGRALLIAGAAGLIVGALFRRR